MKKIDLNLDYGAIRKRIEKKKDRLKPSEWAEKIGVARNVVSNIHGKTNQPPSLEYIIAVSRATGKAIEYFLWGLESYLCEDIEIVGLLEATKQILKSGNQMASDALRRNIEYFSQAVEDQAGLVKTKERFATVEQRLNNLEGGQGLNEIREGDDISRKTEILKKRAM